MSVSQNYISNVLNEMWSPKWAKNVGAIIQKSREAVEDVPNKIENLKKEIEKYKGTAYSELTGLKSKLKMFAIPVGSFIALASFLVIVDKFISISKDKCLQLNPNKRKLCKIKSYEDAKEILEKQLSSCSGDEKCTERIREVIGTYDEKIKELNLID